MRGLEVATMTKYAPRWMETDRRRELHSPPHQTVSHAQRSIGHFSSRTTCLNRLQRVEVHVCPIRFVVDSGYDCTICSTVRVHLERDYSSAKRENANSIIWIYKYTSKFKYEYMFACEHDYICQATCNDPSTHMLSA